ncbi:MAG: hypothetical protein AAFR99_21370, partial [Cyanobacteria bacterium J06629_9]
RRLLAAVSGILMTYPVLQMIGHAYLVMKNKSLGVGGALILSLLLVLVPPQDAQIANAQMATSDVKNFRQIEQPTGIKIGVTALGIGLIGLELGWFLFK